MSSGSPVPSPQEDSPPTPLDREAATLAAPGRQIEGAGAMIGPYKLLQKLGEGGMGQVWVADQEEPVRRRVALKVIKAGMDTEQVIARFEAERQALAMMDHTNIARVLDAGQTNSGRPYFVMELVKGVPITKYCDELHLTLRERLKLFIPVCQAIQHAHQKGIIHRDIKPSNVLVCMQDGQPVPKVIDFGLAKALGQKLSRHTMVTEFGAVVGTLEYMSPEQAELSALDIDTRADVYALGVMLYELLVGTTPLTKQRLQQTAFDELLRCIREVDPPKPSTRLSESKETIASVAALRKTEPIRLTRDLKGDLDWIVMKCLEKDRTRRYDAAAALARDVERFLAFEPIEARPPSLAYQMRKFVRKHRLGIAIATSFLLLLVGATVVSSWQAYRATIAENAAKENEQKALESEREAVEQREIAETNEKRARESERLAKEAAKAAEEARARETESLKKQIDFAKSELSSRKQSYALVEVLEAIFDVDNFERDASEILPRLKEKVEQIVETVDKAEGADPMLRGRLRQALGATLMAFDDYDRAIAELTKAVEVHVSQSGPESAATLSARNRLGLALLSAGRPEEAKKVLEEVHAIRLRLLGPDHRDTLVSLHNLAWYAQKNGDPQSAISKYQEIVERTTRLDGAEHLETVDARDALGVCYREVGMILKAIEEGEFVLRQREKQLGSEDWKTLRSKYNLAWAYGLAGDGDKAIELYTELVEARRKQNGALHWRTLEAISDLAWAYGVKRDYDKAIAKYKEVLEKRRELFGIDDPKTLAAAANLARTYDVAGKPQEALALYPDLCERLRQRLGPDAVETWNAENDYAAACDRAGQHELAAKLYEGVLASKRAKLDPEDPAIAIAINNLGNHYYNTNHYDKALPLYEEAFARQSKRLGPDHRETLVVMVNCGMTLSRLGRHDEAIEKISDALRRQLALSGARHEQVYSWKTALADAYQAKGDLASSLRLNEEIAAAWEKEFGPEHLDVIGRWRIVRWQRAAVGDRRGALEIAQRVHERSSKLLGERDPQAMGDLTYIADYQEGLGDAAAAEPLRRANLEFVKTQPTAMFMTPIATTSLARNLMLQRKFDQATPLLEEVIAFYRTMLPGNVMQYSISLMLAKCYEETGKLEPAEKLLLEAVAGLERAKAFDAAAGMQQLSDLYRRLEKPQEAEAWHVKAEAAKPAARGDQGPAKAADPAR